MPREAARCLKAETQAPKPDAVLPHEAAWAGAAAVMDATSANTAEVDTLIRKGLLQDRLQIIRISQCLAGQAARALDLLCRVVRAFPLGAVAAFAHHVTSLIRSCAVEKGDIAAGSHWLPSDIIIPDTVLRSPLSGAA